MRISSVLTILALVGAAPAAARADDTVAAQKAQMTTAEQLFDAKLYTAALFEVAKVLENPTHPSFDAGARLLAKLGGVIPDPYVVAERASLFDDRTIERAKGDPMLASELAYLAGLYRRRERRTDEALQMFAKVAPSSPRYVHAQLMAAATGVERRRTVQPLKSLQETIAALDRGAVVPGADSGLVRDTANLGIARLFHSTGIAIDDDDNQLHAEPVHLSVAILFLNRVDPTGPLFGESLYEKAWLYFVAGDYPHALGAIKALQSPAFRGEHLAEVSVLEGLTYFSSCDFDRAGKIVASVGATWRPVRDELAILLARLDAKSPPSVVEAFAKSALPETRDILERVLKSRRLARSVAFERVAVADMERWRAMPATFRDSRAGGAARDAIASTTDIAVAEVAAILRGEVERARDDLDEHVRDAMKVLIDVTAAKRGQLEGAIAGGSSADAPPTAPLKLHHLSMPIDGARVRDPGAY